MPRRRQDWRPGEMVYRVTTMIGDDRYYLDELDIGPTLRPRWGRHEAGAIVFWDEEEARFVAELIRKGSGWKRTSVEPGPSYRRR